eukprot:5547385-Pyramimonas_sp.AAC.1
MVTRGDDIGCRYGPPRTSCTALAVLALGSVLLHVEGVLVNLARQQPPTGVDGEPDDGGGKLEVRLRQDAIDLLLGKTLEHAA